MASPIFSARFTPNNSTPVSADEFDVNASIFDGTGEFSGFDVAVNDVVFLDAFPSLSALNTVARYKVIDVISSGSSLVDVRLKWDDSGSIVDPGEITGTVGFISRSSLTDRFAWHAAPTIHGIPDYVIQYARNKELYSTIDGNLGGGGGGGNPTPIIKQMQSAHDSIINAGVPLSKLPSGRIIPADSDALGAQSFCGIAASQFSVSGLGDVYLPGPNIIGAVSGLGFTVGGDVYLNENGGYTQTTSGFSGNNDVILKIGFADCSAGSASSTATDLVMLTDYIVYP
jgi:hypothetical protein